MAVTFKKATTPEVDHIMIVDALNLAFRWKHAGVYEFAESFIDTVRSLKRSYRCSKVIIACDQGSSKYRMELYPGYKSDRKEKAQAQTEAEKLEFQEFFEGFTRTIELIESMPEEFLLLRFEKCEADDIAAYIVSQLSRKSIRAEWDISPDYKVWLISSDKDWDLLISEHVSRFSYKTRKEVSIDTWSDNYDYDIADHISIKCLMGDSGDSVPGVVGIGPKKAHALVREYGSTYDIIASMPIPSKYKHIQSLNEFGKDALLLNYKLMDLLSHSGEALGPENCEIINQKVKEFLSESK